METLDNTIGKEEAPFTTGTEMERFISEFLNGTHKKFHLRVVQWLIPKPPEDCGCLELVEDMNLWGPRVCLMYRKDIVAKITSNAVKASRLRVLWFFDSFVEEQIDGWLDMAIVLTIHEDKITKMENFNAI